MKNILLTGASGFVGTNILSSQLLNDYEILCPSSKELNLLNRNSISQYFTKESPDLVIHAAGKVGGILKNSNSNYNFLLDNSLMAINLISESLSNGIPNFLNLSSSCVYPKNYNSPIKEKDILTGPLEPSNEGYAIAKIIGLKLTELISKEKKGNYKTIIPCNLYGPFDSFNELDAHMMPAAIRKIHNAKISKKNKVVIWGNGKVKREFMYIKDFTNFVKYAIDNFDLLPNILNVGTGKDYTINEYYKAISKVVGYEGSFEYDSKKPSGMERKLVDISNLNQFGWKSLYSLERGINETYQFYLEQYEK